MKFFLISSVDLFLVGIVLENPWTSIYTYLPTSTLGPDMTQGQFLSGV